MRWRGLPGAGETLLTACYAAAPRAAPLDQLVLSGVSHRTERTAAARAMGLIERVLLVAGIVLFLVLLYQIGVAAVWDNIRLVGWGFALILGQEIVAFSLNTLGWHWAFPPPRPPIAFWHLLTARLAGDAINNVTPTATVGGEVLRARMLNGRVEMTNAWASVAIAKLSQTFSQILFIVIGLTIVLKDTRLPAGFRHGLFIGLLLLGTGCAIAIIMQRRGMFTAAAALAHRIGLPVPDRLAEQLQHLDSEIARFYKAPGAFLTSAAYFFGGWLMGVVEIYLIMYFLEMGADWHRALTIAVLSIAIEAVLFFVPAKAGTREGGTVLIFSILGLPAAKGLSLGIVRRIRELSWSMVGLVILSHHQARKESVGRR